MKKTKSIIAGVFIAALACTLHASTQAGELTDSAKSAIQSSDMNSDRKNRAVNYLDHIEVIKGADFNASLAGDSSKDAEEVRNALYLTARYARKDPSILAVLKGPIETVLGLEAGSLSANFRAMSNALRNAK